MLNRLLDGLEKKQPYQVQIHKEIIASSGSAGGHLAAATGTIDAFDEEDEDQEISSKPNAMILFNPVVINSSTPLFELDQQVSQRLKTKYWG